MTINVECAQCGKKYRATDAVAGKILKCKSCGSAINVPLAESGDDPFQFALDEAVDLESSAKAIAIEKPVRSDLKREGPPKKNNKKKSKKAKNEKTTEEGIPLSLVRYMQAVCVMLGLELGAFGLFLVKTAIPEIMKMPPNVAYEWAFFAFFILVVWNGKFWLSAFLDGSRTAMNMWSVSFALFFVLLPLGIFFASGMTPENPEAVKLDSSSILIIRILCVVQIVVILPYFYYFEFTSKYKEQYT